MSTISNDEVSDDIELKQYLKAEGIDSEIVDELIQHRDGFLSGLIMFTGSDDEQDPIFYTPIK